MPGVVPVCVMIAALLHLTSASIRGIAYCWQPLKRIFCESVVSFLFSETVDDKIKNVSQILPLIIHYG